MRDSYIQTVKDAGLYVDAETADLAARKSMGHPYMVQLVGYYMWRSAVRRGSQIIESVMSRMAMRMPSPSSTKRSTRLCLRAAQPQRLFIEAMAVDEDKPSARRYH